MAAYVAPSRRTDVRRPPGRSGSPASMTARRSAAALLAFPGLAMAGASIPACDLNIDVAGTGLGAIPDGAEGGFVCGDPSAALVVTFVVDAVPDVEMADVNVSLQFTHPFMGDLTAVLVAPDATEHTLFGRVATVTDTGCGDNSNMAGPYVFSDFATPPSGGMWQAAVAAADDAAVAPGSYLTTDSGGPGATNPMPPTSLLAAFAGLGPTGFSGSWQVRITDGGRGDVGEITAATLSLCLVAQDVEVFDNGFEFIPL